MRTIVSLTCEHVFGCTCIGDCLLLLKVLIHSTKHVFSVEVQMSESGQSSQTDPSGQDPRTDPSDLANDLPTKAHHPKAFKFPKRNFENKMVVNRSFQSVWFEKWPWLHYVENNDTACTLYHVCGS